MEVLKARVLEKYHKYNVLVSIALIANITFFFPFMTPNQFLSPDLALLVIIIRIIIYNLINMCICVHIHMSSINMQVKLQVLQLSKKRDLAKPGLDLVLTVSE